MIKSKLLDMTKRTSTYLFAFVKWIIIALIIGLVGGFVGVAFHVSVEKVTALREAHSWLIFLLPLGGLVIAALYRLTKLHDIGTNRIIDSVRGQGAIPFLLPPVIFISTVITHLFGGSAGREGAALQLGGGIGTTVARVFFLDEKDANLAVLCGMSALFSALFGTPLTAVFFALEVISVGLLYYSGLIPCLMSSLTAYYISILLKCEPVRFSLPVVPDYDVKGFLRVAAVSAVAAAVSVIFCLAMYYSEEASKKLLKNQFIRIAAGGAIIIALTLVFGHEYGGAGMGIVSEAIEGEKAVPYAFALKLIFTAVTISCGFKGGEIVPTLFVGSTLGCAIAPLIGLNPGFGAAIGLVALFCGNVNCPIASIFLAIEIFGGEGLLYFAASSAISYILSGYFGLYSSQKIMYSKIKAEYININAWHRLYNESNEPAAPEEKND